MKRKIFTLMLFVMSVGILFAQKEALTIKVASKPVTSDGIIDANDPWVEADWVDVDLPKAGNSSTDMTAKFQLKYDKDNLYFGAKVNDDTRNIASTTDHMNDCIEFFIGTDTSQVDAAGTYKLQDRQIRCLAQEDPIKVTGNHLPTAAVYAVKDNGTDYVQEWTMPWSDLTADMDPAWIETCFKFDVQVANSIVPDAREQQMFWNDASDFQWNNTTKFGLAILATPWGSLSVKEVNASKSLIYDVTTSEIRNVKGVVNVYDLSGRAVLKANSKDGKISVASLKEGIYIANSNNASVKFSKR
jgi:hypothetical protein